VLVERGPEHGDALGIDGEDLGAVETRGEAIAEGALHEADDTIRRVRALVIAAGTGPICFAKSTQPSPRGRAAQLELPRCERPGSPQRGSLTLAWISVSARLAYGSPLAPLG